LAVLTAVARKRVDILAAVRESVSEPDGVVDIEPGFGRLEPPSF